MECVANLKITPQDQVDAAKVKMIFSHGSIAILIYVAMVMSLKSACVETLINHGCTTVLVHPVDSTDRSVNHHWIFISSVDPEPTRRRGDPC